MHGFHREVGRRYHVGEGIETARRLFLRQSGRRRQRVPVQCCMVFVVGFAEDEDDFRRAERAGVDRNRLHRFVQAPDRVAVEGLHPQTEKQAFGCRTAFETELRVFA